MKKVTFAIDRGGTFTDVYATCGDSIYVEKLLSEDPSNYQDAPREGIRRVLEKIDSNIYSQENIDASSIAWIRMGTTVATNTLLERKGKRCALLITKGFKDVLQIGNQARESIFDLKCKSHAMLYEEVCEVQERIRPKKSSDGPECSYVSGITEEQFVVVNTLNIKQVESDLLALYNKGIRSLAVVLMHAYSFHEHEKRIGEVAKRIGFTQVSLSHEVMPVVKITTRGDTTIVDAYLNPHIQHYLKSFTEGFNDQLKTTELLFMQSDGGLSSAQQFKGSNAILSGPAGGVVACARAVYAVMKKEVIGFDMGGTSTDVSRYGGEYDMEFESETAGVKISAPQLNINTVAAGGGSRLFFRNGMFEVGPESSGAHPGPVCYKKGGHLSITDANLLLGRLQPDFFPHIFGSSADEPLDIEATRNAFRTLQKEIANQYKQLSLEEIAQGFIRVANEVMCRPIREVSVMRGFDIKEHVLACFGGAGGQHACAIAKTLGMKSVFIHRHSGILSAYGMHVADIVLDDQEPFLKELSIENLTEASKRFRTLEAEHISNFSKRGYKPEQITSTFYFNVRYQNTDTSIMLPLRKDKTLNDALSDFYLREFGFDLHGRSIEIDTLRVRSLIASNSPMQPALSTKIAQPECHKKIPCYFENGYCDTPLYLSDALFEGCHIQGPALIMQDSATIVVEPECHATLNGSGDILITITATENTQSTLHYDPVMLSIFSNLFMSIAEQMGRTLQKTAISTNIKERLDFSCALFDAKGSLIANAPHIPVHLGAMGASVKHIIKSCESVMSPGDLFVTNDPFHGGSHLPDITVISPIYIGKNVEFYVANRGHHAEIGGITPGSMPPFSTSISEEGVKIDAVKMVEKGHFNETLMRKLLSNSRSVGDNIADLKAQAAANSKGIVLLKELVDKYSLEIVHAYMGYIQNAAEKAVRTLLKDVAAALPEGNQMHAEDFMDDGSKISLTITINDDGSALFDFSGTAAQVKGNLNAPKAITTSAVLYALRSQIKNDIPLNDGCLKCVSIHIPERSLLNPNSGAGVVAGNVLTSQRIVDVIFKAFGTCAASQGCMNNLTFGNASFGYYETIAGGAGAGPSWSGRSAVQTHMTNTRITDAEIIERRYPVMVQEFSIRNKSGGEGLFCGGDGTIRDIVALEDGLEFSILSERRKFAPYGLKGGLNGACGENSVQNENGKMLKIGSKDTIKIKKGEHFIIKTPGGGGYGNAKDR